MGWIVTEYDENKVNHIYPEDEKDLHLIDCSIIGYDDTVPGNYEHHRRFSCSCTCRPIFIRHEHGGISITHSSLDGREYVERVQDIVNKGL